MKNPVKKGFHVFSITFFLVVSVIATTVYLISSGQINRSYVEQQLSFASQTIKLHLATAVNSELSLVLKMANTPVIHDYFMNPFDPDLDYSAHIEFEIYQQHFGMGLIFWINDTDKIFYSTGNEPYVVDPDDPGSYWYNYTLYNTERYNFNINYNENMQQINLWINAPVFTNHAGVRRPIGMVGTGVNLTKFSDFIANAYREYELNIIPYTFNKYHEITSAVDFELVSNKVRLDEYLGDTGAQIIRIAQALSEGESMRFSCDERTYLVSSIPEMEWYLAVSYPQPGLFAVNQYMNTLFFGMLFLILIILIVVNIIHFRSANAIAKQNTQLLEANEKAEKANRSKSNFLATMSHEIRTPLNAIIGIAQIEMQDDSLPEKHITAYEKIQSSGNSLLGIINDILDMSKIETGKLEINPVEYDVPSLINDTVQLNILRIGSKQIDFKLNIDNNLPSNLIGDELRIKQILNNLLSNAIKYTEEGQVHFSAEYQPVSDDILLVFSIRDTGQGIKEEDKKKLFSEFVRFNNLENRTIEGTGLGLSITRKLVEMMDGTINVESEYGKGSTFTVAIRQKINKYIPIGEELAGKLNDFSFIEKKRNDIKITREPMPYGSVLVVDDVDTNLYVARGILSSYKLKIETVISGFAAIEKIESGNSYDIIFMDHMMPKMDGIETTQKLRESGYTGTIVALTANALVGNDEMFAQKGFDGFIPKPIDIRQLNNVLNQFVRDRYPEEAKKYKPQTTVITQKAAKEIDPKVKQIFCEDAKKAIITFRETVLSSKAVLAAELPALAAKLPAQQAAMTEDNLKLFTITAHAMKSALANTGEPEASEAAFALESAGQKNDIDFISANIEGFIKTLEGIIVKFSSAETNETVNVNIIEDIQFLKEQLQIVKTACENYDDDTAYTALDRLKEKTWCKETSSKLEQIRDMLFVYSDFDGASKQINVLL